MSGWIGSRARGILVMFGDLILGVSLVRLAGSKSLGVGCHAAALASMSSGSEVFLGKHHEFFEVGMAYPFRC